MSRETQNHNRKTKIELNTVSNGFCFCVCMCECGFYSSKITLRSLLLLIFFFTIKTTNPLLLCFFFFNRSLFVLYFSLTLLTCYLVVLFVSHICKKVKESTHNRIHFAFSSFLFLVGKQGQHQNMRISDSSRSSSSKSRNRDKTVHS